MGKQPFKKNLSQIYNGVFQNVISYRVHERPIFKRLWERVPAKVRSFRSFGRSLFRRVGDPGFDSGRVNVLEAVVLKHGWKLWGQTFKA